MAAPGQLIGPYRLLAMLGKGAMGEVWRARDERLERQVAIKLLPGGLASDPERRARMLREARASAAVPHPGVVTLYDILSEDGHDFLVMELVEGQTLSERLRAQGAMPVRQALDTLIATADALAAAHAQGILHRDIKSANVMITDAGVVKVLDFGLAKLREAGAAATDDEHAEVPLAHRPTGQAAAVALDETMPSTGSSSRYDALETQAGSLLGTPMYMAPEQVRGGRADERSEIFSTGVIGYELLAGRAPYRAQTMDELFAQIEHEPVPPLPDAVPAPVQAAIARALAKDPDARQPSMAVLRDELAAVRRRLYARRTPSWPWLAGAALAIVAAAATVYMVTRPEPAAPVSPGDRYVQRALEEYDVFYNDKALSSLRAAVRHDADHPRANAYLILFGHADAEERGQAARRAQRALEQLAPDQKKAKALIDAALALFHSGPELAHSELLAAGAERDRELDFWSAELAYRAGDYQAADAGFRALLADDTPRLRGRIYDHYSAVLLYFDKIDEALEVGRAYAEAFPGEADAIGVHATTLAAAGQYDRALERAREARHLNEGEDTLAGLAKVHAYRGEFDRARELYAESARRAHPGRRVLRLAALGLLHLIDGDADAARQAVAPCTGELAAVRERGACLWVTGLIDQDRIPDLTAELLALATEDGGRPYGFPVALANLLSARALFQGGGCILPAGYLELADPDAQPVIDAHLRDGRDFYAAYHLPFFNTYPVCERAALARATGDPRRAAEILATTAETHPGRGPLLLELARARAVTDRAAARETLDRFFDQWPSLDRGARLRSEAEALQRSLQE